MSKQDHSKVIIDPSVDENNNSVIKEVIGIVTNCQFLNIRANPDVDSTIVCREPALSELIIDIHKSTDEWYNVCTVAGVEGFCMKKFVTVKQ